LLLQAAGAAAQGLKPTAVEIALLPRFCWSQMKAFGADGEEFKIPSDCGPGMRHYCPGLLSLMRAKSATREDVRRRFLADAKTQVKATMRAMRKYPACSLRQHVRESVDELHRIEALPPPGG
jgi:hypothetical protein